MQRFFEQFPEVVAVMSLGVDGSMKITTDPLLWAQSKKNRQRFFDRVSNNERDILVGAELVHGNTVVGVDTLSEPTLPSCDGLVTKNPQVFLSVTTADCLPVFFYDPRARVCGIAHAGWRGLLTGVLENTLIALQDLGASLEDIHIAVGPSIGLCHFEIQEDVLEQFKDFTQHITKRENKIYVDLKSIAVQKLTQQGIREDAIEVSSACTACDVSMFSYRRDKPEITEVMISLIGMRG